MKEHYKEFDILRGMAIVMVISGHAIILFPINLHEIMWCEYLFTAVCSVHMPLFFLISGACYSYKSNNYGQFIVKKVKRLVVPYLFFCMLSMSMKLFFPKLINGEENLIDSLKAVIFSGGSTGSFTYCLKYFC